MNKKTEIKYKAAIKTKKTNEILKYTDLIGRIKDNRKFTGSKEKGKGMGMEEMKKSKQVRLLCLSSALSPLL